MTTKSKSFQTPSLQQNRGETFWFHLFSGGIAGGVSRTAVAPLERIKLILQTQKMLKIKEVANFKGFWDAFFKIKNDQGFSSFWRGNGINIFRIVPNIAIRFATYDKFKSYAMPEGDFYYTGYDKFFRRILGGVTSGIVTMLFTYPLDVIRVSLATDMSKNQDARIYKGFNQCCKSILKSQGVQGLYKGYFITTLGLAPYLGISFTLYDTLKNYMLKQKQDNYFVNLVQFLGIGSFSGMFAQFITYPLDTIRRRLQVNGAINYQNDYRNGINCFVKMYRYEGIKSFYAGLIINLIKVAPAAGIQFSVYDMFKTVQVN